MSIPDLINLTNQFSCTLDESPKWETTKILNLQIQQMKAPKQNQNPPSFCYYCKELGHWKRDCYKFKYFRHLQLSNQPFQHPPNSQLWGSEELPGIFPILPLNRLGETFLQIGNGSLPALNDAAATLSVLNATNIKQPLPGNIKAFQDSPGSPVVKTPCFQFRGLGFDPWLGN